MPVQSDSESLTQIALSILVLPVSEIIPDTSIHSNILDASAHSSAPSSVHSLRASFHGGRNRDASRDSVQSNARAQKASLDDDLDNAQIQAINESVSFLTKYVRDATDPDIVVKYVNMIKEQWTQQLSLLNGIQCRGQKMSGGTGSDNESPDEKKHERGQTVVLPMCNDHGTPLSA
jgi:isopentenyl diphosphate isomerase/L-lactate dehydrogenase-like FMN-dependent dehydrogenase